jgi:hypothetical protein
VALWVLAPPAPNHGSQNPVPRNEIGHRLAVLSLPPDTDPSVSIGVITTVRLWRRVGPISTLGNLVIYEDCLVFATIGPREDGWLSRMVTGSSAAAAQFRRIGEEQATVEPERLVLHGRRNLLIHRDRVERARLTQSRTSSAGGDELVSGVLGLIADIGAPIQHVLSIKLKSVGSKLTIQGKWGARECEWLQRALGDKLAARSS